jgi:tetratricopeptide (TPR) repeat protein
MHKLPGTDPVELTTAEAFMKEERFSDAVALFEDILEKKPHMKDRVKVPYSKALQGKATKIEAHDVKKAKKLLLKSIETDPDNAGGHYQLGRIYTKQKNYPGAIASYKRAAELDPEMAEVFFNLGYIYYAVNKDYSQAYAMYRHAARLSPPFLDEALFNLALVQNRLGKRQESIKSLERAISVNPKNRQAEKFLKYVKRKQK